MSSKPGSTSLEVQLFGRLDSRATQKALRFFHERRIKVAFVNLAQRPIAPTELRRFTARFGAPSLVDSESRAYREQGLAYLSVDDQELFERLLSNNSLIRLPLVRAGDRLTVGVDEDAWRSLLVKDGGPA